MSSIVIIDDHPEEQRALAAALGSALAAALGSALAAALGSALVARTLHPQDLTIEDLYNADLVLVDLRLKYWPTRDAQLEIGLSPEDGIALAGVLRAQTERGASPTTTAYALHSAHLDDIATDSPLDIREYVLARAINLEWVFRKRDEQGDQIRKIRSLANAAGRLSGPWRSTDGGGGAETDVSKLLSLDRRTKWWVRAWRDIESCHLQTDEISLKQGGLTFLRWMLHRIMPYPCFLWDDLTLAARLGYTVESLRDALARDGSFRQVLNPTQYRGILDDFDGRRWWRAGVEALLWDLADGNATRESIESTLSPEETRILEPIQLDHAVVVVDKTFRRLEEFVSIHEAVRLQPKDWPPYADQAWPASAW